MFVTSDEILNVVERFLLVCGFVCFFYFPSVSHFVLTNLC